MFLGIKRALTDLDHYHYRITLELWLYIDGGHIQMSSFHSLFFYLIHPLYWRQQGR